MSLQRCMSETTSSEFVDWQRFFKQELGNPTRGEYYLAQIAAEVRRHIARKPLDVDKSQFLMKFEYSSGEADTHKTPVDPETKVATSKAFWFGFVGINPEAT